MINYGECSFWLRTSGKTLITTVLPHIHLPFVDWSGYLWNNKAWYDKVLQNLIEKNIIITWTIWNCTNNIIFQNHPFNPEYILESSLRHVIILYYNITSLTLYITEECVCQQEEYQRRQQQHQRDPSSNRMV